MKLSKEEIKQAYHHLVKKTRDTLQTPQCREFLFFLFFIFIASVFWILQTLNETYTTEVNVPLRIKNVPENVVFTSDIPQALSLTIEDKGTVLSKYMLGKKISPITLDFKEYKNNHIRLLTSELEKKLLSQLAVSTKLQDISPDTIEIFYSQSEGKKIPVRIRGNITPKQQYYIAKRAITPDSVTVYAPKNILQTLNEAYTQPFHLTEVADTMSYMAEIAQQKGVKFIPEKVKIQFHADILTEKTIAVPIVGIDFPPNTQLKTFPSKVNVTFQVGMQHFKDITAEDFTIGISYHTLQQLTSHERCEPEVITSPDNVSHIRISPTNVEYLIEQSHQ